MNPAMNLRRGYTTGACAQAAAAAAAEILAAGRPLEGGADPARDPARGPAGRAGGEHTGDHARGTVDGAIAVVLPNGERASFAYEAEISAAGPPEAGRDRVTAWVLKDGGDDPDVTDGLRIGAEVFRSEGGFSIEAGEGVGTVTLPGLALDPGAPAVNPVPREAVLAEVRERIPEGAVIRLHVPGGEEAAGRTLNPRLGVVGGISILGTTGRVEPWSVEAMRESLVPQLDVAAAREREELVFVLGAKGRRLAEEAGWAESDVVEVGNEIGWMLGQAAERGFRRVAVRGHIGKLTKLAAGIFDTHSRVADARLVTLAAYAGAVGVEPEEIRRILSEATAEAAAARLVALGRTDALDEVARAGAAACAQRYGVSVRLIVLDRGGTVQADSGWADS